MPSFDRDDVLAAMAGRFADFYGQWTMLKPQGRESRGPCPLHNGSGPNFSVNPDTGLWKCFTGCQAGGSIFDFLQKKCGFAFPEALAEVAAFAGMVGTDTKLPSRGPRSSWQTAPEPAAVFLDITLAENLHENLMNSTKVCRWLLEHRGLTAETLQRFQLGLLPRTEAEPYWRICFPVYDAEGMLTNIRKHLFSYKPELTDEKRRELGKTKPWQSGLRADLYPVSVLNGATEAVIIEGEGDTILACQLGLVAITGTGGAGTWHERWNNALASLQRVTIFYDDDAVGLAGAQKVAASVRCAVPDVRTARSGTWKGRQ